MASVLEVEDRHLDISLEHILWHGSRYVNSLDISLGFGIICTEEVTIMRSITDQTQCLMVCSNIRTAAFLLPMMTGLQITLKRVAKCIP